MKVLDSKTVVVSNSDELKEILEEDNTYSYIYLDSDITLTEGITINQDKNRIIIDGTYDNVRHTLTGLDSSESTDTIIVSSIEGKYTFQNIDMVGSNLYGMIYVPSNSIYANLITEFINIKFNGVELSYNPYGVVIIMDSNITTEDTNEKTAQRVCDANKIEIGGKTTIYSTAVHAVLFSFLTTTLDPSITFLPNSRVTITTELREFMNGTTRLGFYVLHDANVYISTGNGFAAYTFHGTNNVLIDERASLTFLETKHQRVPMWVIYGVLTVNEEASVSIINTYASTPSDNYNIRFKGTANKIILNNPKSFVMYSKNANVMYTENPLEFSFNVSRANFWVDSTDVLVAGSISNIPDFSYYKEDELMMINGTFTTTETTVTSHNFTEEELKTIPDISNFSFINRKQFSVDNSYLTIYPINNTSQAIMGYTENLSEILIKYDGNEINVNVESDGSFSYPLDNVIPDNTNIEITSCVPTSFIYETRKLVTPHNGELTLVKGSNNVPFTLNPINLSPVILPKTSDTALIIVDSRINSSEFKVYVKLLKQMESETGKVLTDAVIFKNLGDSISTLNENNLLVYTGENNEGTNKITTVTWSTDKGILLSLENNALEINEEYNAKVVWTIEE